MNRSESRTTGLYREGTSLLHRLDPRLKLGMLLLLVVTLFAGPSTYRLLILSVICYCGIASCGISYMQVVKKLLSLRWLLLFSLLLHLFFTPGRTLFGTSWLSYDGLLRGLTVDLQLVLSLLLSYLLALTTSPSALAWGLGSLLSPFSYVGLPIREGSGMLLLVLHFVPQVRDEAMSLKQKKHVSGFLERIHAASSLVGPLLMRLVDRADALAHEIATEGVSLESEVDRQEGRFGCQDLWVLSVCLPVLVLLWIL